MTDTRRQVHLPSDRDATGRDLGDAELELLTEAIRSGHLNSTGGTLVPRFEAAFASTATGTGHAIACASGSAAVHAALGSLALAAGDEVVTTPITDMGAITPILYEGLVPVFCDVDPTTGNVTAETVRRVLTDRTRAIIVTHLFGQPCDLAPLRRLADERGVVLIEDAAQAFLATDAGARIGSVGDLACFSFQQGKHMTTGEGGVVTTTDPERANGVRRFVNKGWGYGDPNPDHDRAALNYRLTELQGAVALAQLDKLAGVVERRQRAAAALIAALGDELTGVELPHPRPDSTHVYWRLALRVAPSIGADSFGHHLGSCGVANAPRYIKKPAFACGLFRNGADQAVVSAPWRARGEPVPTWNTADYPGVERFLESVVVLPWNEHYDDEHVTFVADAIRAAWRATTGDGGAV